MKKKISVGDIVALCDTELLRGVDGRIGEVADLTDGGAYIWVSDSCRWWFPFDKFSKIDDAHDTYTVVEGWEPVHYCVAYNGKDAIRQTVVGAISQLGAVAFKGYHEPEEL